VICIWRHFNKEYIICLSVRTSFQSCYCHDDFIDIKHFMRTCTKRLLISYMPQIVVDNNLKQYALTSPSTLKLSVKIVRNPPPLGRVIWNRFCLDWRTSTLWKKFPSRGNFLVLEFILERTQCNDMIDIPLESHILLSSFIFKQFIFSQRPSNLLHNKWIIIIF